MVLYFSTVPILVACKFAAFAGPIANVFAVVAIGFGLYFVIQNLSLLD